MDEGKLNPLLKKAVAEIKRRDAERYVVTEMEVGKAYVMGLRESIKAKKREARAVSEEIEKMLPALDAPLHEVRQRAIFELKKKLSELKRLTEQIGSK